jgi:uncharacterized repeat protein (TIGR03803 family)
MFSSRVVLTSMLLGSVALIGVGHSAQARSYTVLHEFAGAPNDGAFPYNDVTFDDAGVLYGTTNLGGSSNNGTIFKLTPSGTYTVLHSFDGGATGSDPNAGVTIDPTSGDLYGTTTFGGMASCRNSCGIFYRLAADGTYTVLHSFDNADDGQYPAGLLIRDKLGTIFGSTTSGGPNGGGTVFSYNAKGKFKMVHAFGGVDGFSPQGRLLRGQSGELYGVTMQGGANGYGTAYKMAPGGNRFSVLYSFTGGADGGYPSGGLDRDKAGNLYGATNLAGNGATPNGTVFKLAPDGTLTTLYAFSGGADGLFPAGNILLNHGKIYGTTTGGGQDEDGVVYAVDLASGNENVVHSFADTDGAGPQAGLTRRQGVLYGAASGGGANGVGVLYRIEKK